MTVNTSAAPPRLPEAFAVAVVAGIAHLSFYSATAAIVWLDSVRYVDLSFDLPHRLATGQWDLWSTPAYPFFLWLVRPWTASVEGVALIQQCLAITTCLLVWLSARKMFGARAALACAVLVALSPFRHYYAQTILSEQLAELLLVSGFAVLVLAIDAPLPRFLGWRALGGVVLGLAALTRPNLAPAAALATLTPIAPRAARQRGGLVLGMLLTGLAATSMVAPWVHFNVQRGVTGFTGNVGYALNLLANELDIGTPVNLREEFPLNTYTVEKDRGLVRLALHRFGSQPVAYARGVLRTTRRLFVPLYAWGDVSPHIGLCQTHPEIAAILVSAWPTYAGFAPAEQRVPARWRCSIHTGLMPIISLLITIGWLGLTAWIIDSLLRARFDLALLASLPFLCVLPLCLMIQANTRYAFPCEALALGLGLPASLVLVRHYALPGLHAPSVERPSVESRGPGETLWPARGTWATSSNSESRRSHQLSVQVEARQGGAAPDNDAPADLLVVVTDPLTGAGVTNLTQDDFQVINHFALPGQACSYGDITLFSSLGTGAYRIQVRPRGRTWVGGEYLTQIMVSGQPGDGRATATLSIR